MRPLWKGSISFGLVNIPVLLYPAVHTEELRFRLLRRSDQSPVDYKRVAEKDGKEVPWDEIVKGYEYRKGKFVVLREEDFRRVDIEATQTVDIESFVELKEVSPVFFHKPYYMEPGKGADRAYVLLREALERSGKIGIAKVVIRTRQHLAAVKPQDGGLMLELMHFADELRDTSEFRTPKSVRMEAKEKRMADTLIESMSMKWDPEAYRDDYRDALKKVIQEKVKRGDRDPAPAPAPERKPTRIIDLAEVLQQSLEAHRKGSGRSGAEKKAKTAKQSEGGKKKERKATAGGRKSKSKSRSAEAENAA